MNEQKDEFRLICRSLPAYKPSKPLWPGTRAALNEDKKNVAIFAAAAAACAAALLILSLSARQKPAERADYHAAYYGSCGVDEHFGQAGRRGLPEYIQNEEGV